jgi:hypothetical protein
LETELKKPAEVRLIASSTQIIPNEKGMDEWGNFPLERQRLFELIAKTQANGVILLSGNVHFSEVSQLEDGSLTEFTASGMTHVNEAYAKAPNKFRIAGPAVVHNFGLVEIDWQTHKPIITLKAINTQGGVLFSHRITLNRKQGNVVSNDRERTVCTDPRPQVCTMDYRPVCGQLDDGSAKTYANSCNACSDASVVDYTDGTCMEPQKKRQE